MVSAKSLTPEVAIITGPTASGKTSLAIDFAVRFSTDSAKNPSRIPIEIISADSLTVYEGFNIGGAKPTVEDQKGIPHHLLNVSAPATRFDAGKFVTEAEKLIEEIHSRGARAMIVGGTGFYLKAFLFGMWEGAPKDEAFRASVERFSTEELATRLGRPAEENSWPYTFSRNDRYRLIRALEVKEQTGEPTGKERHLSPPRKGCPVLWIDQPDSEIHARIHARTEDMLRLGLIEEVKSLQTSFPGASGLETVGYREVIEYLNGVEPEGRKRRPGLIGLADEISLATRQLVKKQRTFFKGQIESSPEVNVSKFRLPEEREQAFSRLTEIYSQSDSLEN